MTSISWISDVSAKIGSSMPGEVVVRMFVTKEAIPSRIMYLFKDCHRSE